MIEEDFFEEEWDEEELEDWEDPYSCLGTFTPGVEECEVCPMWKLCEELTDDSWMIDEEEAIKKEPNAELERLKKALEREEHPLVRQIIRDKIEMLEKERDRRGEYRN